MLKFEVEEKVLNNLDKQIEILDQQIKENEIRLHAIKETKKELQNIVKSIIEKSLPF